MPAAPTIAEPLATRRAGRGTDPLRTRDRRGPTKAKSRRRRRQRSGPNSGANADGLAGRQLRSMACEHLRLQMPHFAPLLEEVELAGWSASGTTAGVNFHDWLLLGDGRTLVTVGHCSNPGATSVAHNGTRDAANAAHLADDAPASPFEAALVAQAAWSAVRALAHHTDDAGSLLSLAARTLWPLPAPRPHASLAVALVDSLGGRASLAIAGDCLVWRIRAATWEQLPAGQPPLGAALDFAYQTYSLQLSLRERLLLVADDPAERPDRLPTSLLAHFAQADAETHRRMTASDVVASARRHYEAATAPRASTSIVAVRRR